MVLYISMLNVVKFITNSAYLLLKSMCITNGVEGFNTSSYPTRSRPLTTLWRHTRGYIVEKPPPDQELNAD